MPVEISIASGPMWFHDRRNRSLVLRPVRAASLKAAIIWADEVASSRFMSSGVQMIIERSLL
ncbi:hypothetical protein D3C72_2562180 [compost metagenome]